MKTTGYKIKRIFLAVLFIMAGLILTSFTGDSGQYALDLE